MRNIEKEFEDVQKLLPNMSDVAMRCAKQRLQDGYTVEETVDNIIYNMNGYTLEEYIQDLIDLDLI